MGTTDTLITGAMPTSHASSASRGWRGVMLEFFHGIDTDFSAAFGSHGITLPLNGCIDLYQWFEGKSSHTRMRRGDLILTPSGVPKRFQHGPGGDFLVVHIAPELFQRVAQDFKQPGGSVELLHSFCTRDAQIEKLALQLWDEYLTDDLASGICAESLGVLLVVRLLRKHSTVAGNSEPLSSRLPGRALERAVDYIEANLANDLSLTDIAAALSMSAGHFARSFRKTTGIAPHRYVLERRLELAERLLRDTELPVSVVAGRAGFTTSSHFCVSFQKRTGRTPSAFRRTASKLA